MGLKLKLKVELVQIIINFSFIELDFTKSEFTVKLTEQVKAMALEQLGQRLV
jgi:hypothetical protein